MTAIGAITSALISTPDAAPAARQDPAAPAPPAPVADRLDIQPLDISGALQILITEAEDALRALALNASAVPDALPAAAAAAAADGAAAARSPAHAAAAIVDFFLEAIPAADLSPSAWSAATDALEAALREGLSRALAAVSRWHDTPAAVIDAAVESATFVRGVLEEPPLANALLLRPEWFEFAARLEGFRRRRRLLRRRLRDPDHPATAFEPRTDDP